MLPSAGSRHRAGSRTVSSHSGPASVQIVDSAASSEELLGQVFLRTAEVASHILQDSGQSADPKTKMRGNRDVMLAILLGCQPHMGAALPRDVVPERRERAGEIAPSEVPRQPHKARS